MRSISALYQITVFLKPRTVSSQGEYLHASIRSYGTGEHAGDYVMKVECAMPDIPAGIDGAFISRKFRRYGVGCCQCPASEPENYRL